MLGNIQQQWLIKIKYKTSYNEGIKSDYTIENLEDLKDLYAELKLKSDD